MQRWLAGERPNGGPFYFVTERGRVGTLRNELGAHARTEVLADTDVSSEFTLVRAEL